MDPAPPPEPVKYIAPYEYKSKEPVYKSTGKFPKKDDAIIFKIGEFRDLNLLLNK